MATYIHKHTSVLNLVKSITIVQIQEMQKGRSSHLFVFYWEYLTGSVGSLTLSIASCYLFVEEVHALI